MPLSWRSLAAATLLLLLPGCPGRSRPPEPPQEAVDAGAPARPEVEPNDAQGQAQRLEVEGQVEAQLMVEPGKVDVDWYVLAPPQARVARVEVSGIPGADVAVEVLDAAGVRRALVNGRGEGQPELVPNLYVEGKAWLKVMSAKKGAGGAYTLAVRFEAPLDGFEREPDDRAVDAVPTPLGTAVRGYVTHGLDEDWYRVALPEAPADADAGGAADGGPGEDAGTAAPRALKLELTALEGVRQELSVLTEAEAVLLQSRGREGAPLLVRNVGLRAQDRFVYVVVRSAPLDAGKDARRGSRPEEAYALTVQFEETAGDGELEPNDSPDKATPLQPDAEPHGFLSPASDVDCYALSGTEGLLLRAQLTGVEGVDLQLSLFERGADGGEVELLRANEGGEKEPERLANVSCAGECWLRVAGVSRRVEGKWVKDQENATAPYALQLSAVADDGSTEREPNHEAARAVPLEPGNSVRGTVYPRRDVDLYRVDLSARPVKTPLVATLTGVLKVDVGLYLHRVAEDGSLSLVQTSDGAKGDKPEIIRYAAEPGIYVLEVRDAKNRESNFQDSYVLKLEEGQE
jgi:hypothetical protein